MQGCQLCRDGFFDCCLAVLTDVVIVVLKADAVEDEILDEIGLILVNVLLKMQDVSLDGLVDEIGRTYY